MLLWLVLTCCFTPLDPFFGPQGMELVLPTWIISLVKLGLKSYLLKKGTISMFIFQQTDFNPKIEINELLFGCKECMKHWKRCIIRLFFWLTYIILFTSLQKRVGCIGMFFELQFNCIDLWPLLLLVAASAISCGS